MPHHLLPPGHPDVTLIEVTPGRGQPQRQPATGCKWVVFWMLILSSMAFMMIAPNMKPPKPIVFVWPRNLTRDVSDLIFPNATTTILAPDSLTEGTCTHKSTPKGMLLLLVVVCSGVSNSEQRKTVRESWSREELTPPGVKVVFLLGQAQNASLQDEVIQEQSLYGDLIQERFVDDYSNLTVKSLMMLKWFTKHCSKVPYVLKTDDDMYINLRYLRDILVANKKPNLLMGSLICGARPIRDPHNKWYAPEYMFPQKVYPNYLSGTAYVLSLSTANLLLEASLETPIFHLEDIYITGVLSREVSIRPQDHIGFTYLKRLTSLPCLYAQSVSSHHLSRQEMLTMADTLASTSVEILASNKKCKLLKMSQRRGYGPGKCKWP